MVVECEEVKEGVCFSSLHFHLFFFVQNLTILQGMLSGGDDGLGDGVLANYNGMKFRLNDVVDVIVGTRVGVRGNKTEPIKARFKGVVERLGGLSFCVDLWLVQGREGVPNSQEKVCLRLVRLGLVCWGRGRHGFFRSCSRHNKTGIECMTCASLTLSCLLLMSLSYIFVCFSGSCNVRMQGYTTHMRRR